MVKKKMQTQKVLAALGRQHASHSMSSRQDEAKQQALLMASALPTPGSHSESNCWSHTQPFPPPGSEGGRVGRGWEGGGGSWRLKPPGSWGAESGVRGFFRAKSFLH